MLLVHKGDGSNSSKQAQVIRDDINFIRDLRDVLFSGVILDRTNCIESGAHSDLL
jgi:capsular polysaccharide biosynthesis protein